MSTPKTKELAVADSPAVDNAAAAAPISAASPAAASVPAAPDVEQPDIGRRRPRYDGPKPPVFQTGGTYLHEV